MAPDTTPRLSPPDELAHNDFEMVVRRLADDIAFGTDASLFVGSGLEYAQSRPYLPGDPVRQINWRLSARARKLFVKEYETLKRTTIFIVIDTSASMNVGSHRLTKHDLAIWIGAAIGLLGQRRMSPVGLLGGGERETRLDPSLKRTDLWHALEPLRAGSPTEATRLGDRLRSLAPRASRASMVVIISDFHDPEAGGAVRRLAQRHDCIAIHLHDPAEAGRLNAGFFRGREAETGRTFIARGRTRWSSADAVKDELIRAGVSYLRLSPDRAFVAPLRHFLINRARLAGGGR